ncbi:MAG: S1 family peptidase [Beijerinckiaceae bacterium]
MIRTLSLLALAALTVPDAALALGGEAASAGSSRLESRVVMVLGDRGNVCSGSVLSPTVVITAAHCVTGSGQYAVAYREAGSPVLQQVRQVAKHPGFSASARVSTDMALIRLSMPLPARFSAVPLDDSTDGEDVGTRQTIAGFGLAGEGDEASAGRLRTAEVKVLPRFYPRFMRLGLNGQGDVRICKGDSGGPVFSEGLVSLKLTGVIYASEKKNGGRHCGDTAQAVRIGPQRGWIDGVRAKWGE